MSNSKSTDYIDYCTQQVVANDRERMLCVVMAPKAARAGLVSLLAWNLEIAKVGEVASEDMVGLIRYQWWRDALDEIYDHKPLRQHAVVLALAETIRQHDLPKAAFLQIISVRESDLDRAPFDSLEALDAYAAITGGTLLKLWLMIVGVDDKNTDDAVKHVGAAWALVGSLRACHHAAHMGKMRLPADALGAVDMDADNILQNGFTPEVRHAVKTVAKQAERHIEDARTLRRSLPDVALSPLYLAVLAEDFLQRIKDTAYDPAHPKVARGRAIRAIKLWWADKRKQY